MHVVATTPKVSRRPSSDDVHDHDYLAVAVGFEPTEELPPHTLSRSVIVSPGAFCAVLTCWENPPPDNSEPRRPEVNETRIETKRRPWTPSPRGSFASSSRTLGRLAVPSHRRGHGPDMDRLRTTPVGRVAALLCCTLLAGWLRPLPSEAGRQRAGGGVMRCQERPSGATRNGTLVARRDGAEEAETPPVSQPLRQRSLTVRDRCPCDFHHGEDLVKQSRWSSNGGLRVECVLGKPVGWVIPRLYTTV